MADGVRVYVCELFETVEADSQLAEAPVGAGLAEEGRWCRYVVQGKCGRLRGELTLPVNAGRERNGFFGYKDSDIVERGYDRRYSSIVTLKWDVPVGGRKQPAHG